VCVYACSRETFTPLLKNYIPFLSLASVFSHINIYTYALKHKYAHIYIKASRVQIELEDMAKGTGIFWKSQKYRDRVNFNHQTNQITLLPFQFISASGVRLSAGNDNLLKRFVKEQSVLIKANGQKRYRSVGRDLLKFSRLQAQSVDMSGIEACVTDIWMINSPIDAEVCASAFLKCSLSLSDFKMSLYLYL
jgi:hypothetical protein